MAELILVNPSARKKRKSTKRRTPAQKRATAKMVAANRRRRKPATRQLALASPRRRKRRGPISANRRRVSTRRKYARNPTARGLRLNGLMAPLSDAAMMSAGAVGIHAAWAYLAPMIPPSIKLAMPGMPHALKAATALGIGALVLPMVTSKANAHKLTAGAVAAVITGFAWSKLSPYIAPDSTADGLSEYESGMGMWLNDPNLGYLYNDAAINGGRLPDYSGAPSYAGYNSAALD